jgi:hypothetical protein
MEAVDLGHRWWEGFAPILRDSFSAFRVKVCKGRVQVVVVAPSAIRSPRLQPHLDSNVERLVGVVWCSRISFGCGDLRIIKELHRQLMRVDNHPVGNPKRRYDEHSSKSSLDKKPRLSNQ